MNKPMAFLLALALAGCATNMRWVKAGATPADFDQDKTTCLYEAKKATGSIGYAGPGMGNAIAQGIEQGMRENEIGTLCMKTKGWNLEHIQQ